MRCAILTLLSYLHVFVFADRTPNLRPHPPSTCADAGPWPCDEAGCPAPLISCSLSGSDSNNPDTTLSAHPRCNLTFGDIFERPPAGMAREAIQKHCKRSCGACTIDAAGVRDPGASHKHSAGSSCYPYGITFAKRVAHIAAVPTIVYAPRRGIPPGSSIEAKCCLFYTASARTHPVQSVQQVSYLCLCLYLRLHLPLCLCLNLHLCLRPRMQVWGERMLAERLASFGFLHIALNAASFASFYTHLWPALERENISFALVTSGEDTSLPWEEFSCRSPEMITKPRRTSLPAGAALRRFLVCHSLPTAYPFDLFPLFPS